MKMSRLPRFNSCARVCWVLVAIMLLAASQIITKTIAQTINIGPAEQLYTDAQLPFTMDASFATLKRDSSTMEFFETDRGTSVYPLRYNGPLDSPLQTHDANAGWDFSGIYTGGVSGPWLDNIYDNGSGTLIGLIHREDFSKNLGFFAIGLSKSTDGGANWKYLGDILRPYGNNANGNWYCSNIGGVPYLIVGNYMYVYFNEHTTADLTGYKRLAVARALTSDIMAAAANNSVPAFYKYAGGAWTQNGLTGLADNIIPNGESPHTDQNISRDFHSDAAYCASLGKYLITVQTHSQGKLLLFTSTDGINWGNETVVDSVSGFSQPYSTFVSLSADASSDCRVVGSDFYLIYPHKDVSNYRNDTLYRRRITLGLPAAGTYKVQCRTNGIMLDSYGRTTAGDSCAIYLTDSGHVNQTWTISYVGSNVINLRAVGGGLYLDGGGLTANGATCKLWTTSTSSNLRWMLIDAGGGYFKLKNVTTGQCVDVGASPWANGDNCEQWSEGTSTNQQWRFITP